MNHHILLSFLEFRDGEFVRYLISTASLFLFMSLIILTVHAFLKRGKNKSQTSASFRFSKYFRTPLILLAVVIAVWLPMLFLEIPEKFSAPLNKLLSILLIAVIAWIAIRTTGVIKQIILSRYDIDQKDNLEARKVYTQFRIIERVVVFIIIILAVSISLMSFGVIRKLGISILASAGLAGIILGFAAQRVIGGILAGIQLAISQPVRLDDVVIVENEWGRIEEINLTFVVIRLWDQRRLIVPTTYFIEKPFQNWTKTTSEITGTVFIRADYTLPVERVRDELARLLKESDLWDGRTGILQVTDADDTTIELRALVSASDASRAFDLRAHIRENLIRFIQKNYPHSLPHRRISNKGEGISVDG